MDLKEVSIDRMSDPGEANTLAAPLGTVVSFASSPPVADDDMALMLRYRDGDVRAFELLYGRHKGPLYRYLKRLCHDAAIADDLFQEVWGKVIASRDRYEPRAQFNTFLFRIAHNCAVDYFRRAGRQQMGRMDDVDELQESLADTPSIEPEVQASEAQVRASYRQALEQLPAEQREAFLLYEESGLSLEDIGRITGVAMETAKSRLRYAFRKLRTALQPHRPRDLEPSTES